MASFLSRLEELLECAICTNTLDEPKILPCHHSFCTECLEIYCQNVNQQTCPSCNVVFHIPDGVTGLPMSFLIGKIVEMVKAAKDEKLKRDVCDMHPTKAIKFFCLTCNSASCTDCIILHSKHEFGDFNAIAEDFRVKFCSYVEQITNHVKSSKTAIERRTNVLQELQDQQRIAIEEMDKRSDLEMDMIHKMKHELFWADQ